MKKVHFDNGKVRLVGVGWNPGGVTEVMRDTCKGATVEAGTLTVDSELVTCKRCLLRMVRAELQKPSEIVATKDAAQKFRIRVT
jgi:hypothetical protein